MLAVREAGCHWRAYLAHVGLVLILSWACLHALSEKQEMTKRALTADTTVGVTYPHSLPSLPVPSPSSTCGGIQPAAEESRCMEWQAAVAARDQAFWANWTFFLGCAGTAAILATLLFTFRATNAAVCSANTAAVQTELARTEFLSTHRPKIILREATVNTLLEEVEIEVVMLFASVGDTHAEIVNSLVRIEVVAEGVVRMFAHPSIERWNELGRQRIAPGAQWVAVLGRDTLSPNWVSSNFSPRVALRGTKFGKSIAAAKAIHLSGQLSYDDEVGINRRMAFCRVLRPRTAAILQIAR